MSPTLYYLIFKLNCVGDYDVFEKHQGQGKGDLMTTPEPVDVILRNDVDKFVSEFAAKCESYGDKLVSYEVVL